MPRSTNAASAIPSDRYPNTSLARALHIHYGMQHGMNRDEALWHAESIVGPLEARYLGRVKRPARRRTTKSVKSTKSVTSRKTAPSPTRSVKRAGRPLRARPNAKKSSSKRAAGNRPGRAKTTARPSRAAGRSARHGAVRRSLKSRTR